MTGGRATGAGPPPGVQPGERLIVLFTHPGLARLLAVLPGIGVPVLPADYLRLERVFAPDLALPWQQARDLLADLLAKDAEAHGRVTALFQRFIPPPADAPARQPAPRADPAPAGHPAPPAPTAPPPDTPEPLWLPPPPPRRLPIFRLTLLLVALLALAALGVWLAPAPPEPPEPTPVLTPPPPAATPGDPDALPADPIAHFHAWVPVLNLQDAAGAPPWWPALPLLCAGLLGLGWLWQRLRDLARPWGGLPRPPLRGDGQRVPAWPARRYAPPPVLHRQQRRDLIWGVQRYASARPTRALDAVGTVGASARAGTPRLRFRPARRERSVWLWQDTRLEDPRLRTLGDELADLLGRAGLPVRRARFNGVPDPLWLDYQTPSHPEDLSGPAQQALVVILSDAETLTAAVTAPRRDSARVHRVLRELRAWPRVCLVTPADAPGAPDPLGLPRIRVADLPAWIGERPAHRPGPAPGPAVAGDVALWAALCALPDLPITQQQCAALRERLALGVGLLADDADPWAAPPGALAQGVGLRFDPARRHRLLQDLAARLWRGRQAGHRGGPVERALTIAIDFWQAELAGLEGAADTAPDPRPWRHSEAAHRAAAEGSLLDLWRPAPGARAQAVAALFARHRLPAAGGAGPGGVDGGLARWLRGRLGQYAAQGMGADAGRIPLPWAWDEHRAAAAPDERPGATQARLLAMGFAGAAPDPHPRPAPAAALGLGLAAGLVLGAAGWLLGHWLVPPAPALGRLAQGTPVDPAGTAPLERAFAAVARDNRGAGGRLVAGGPKLARTHPLPAGARGTLTWCWSGLAPPVDGPCAALTGPEYEQDRANAVAGAAGDGTLLLRAGTLAEPVRACVAPERLAEDPDARPWPDLSVAVMESPAQYPSADARPADAAAAADARRLAIQLLDGGAVDLAIVGPDWRAEARALAAERAAGGLWPDSQWLFFRPADTDPAPAPLLPPGAAPHQLLLTGDPGALARHLWRQRTGPAAPRPDPERGLTRLPPGLRARTLAGAPRLWDGPALRRQRLGDGTATMDFVHLCPGTFTMGGDQFGDEQPRHPVLLDGFWIARTETTNAQLAALPAAERIDDPDARAGFTARAAAALTAPGTLPVADISWHGATAVCGALGGALPSEAQWERAARAGSATAWSWGDDADEAGEFAWFSGNSGAEAHAVDTRRRNPLGLADLHGNLWEWGRDCYADTTYRDRLDRLGWQPLADGDACPRVLRGGSFFNGPRNLRSAIRNWFEPEIRYVNIGFRCARSGAPALDNSTP